MMNMTHPYHLVNLSPWPVISIYSALFLTVSLVNWFHYMLTLFVLISVIAVVFSMLQWWLDGIREGTLQGLHTKKVQTGLKGGMILFITSEVMFSFSFFWAFFHSSLSPSLELGLVWPPSGVYPLNFVEVPLLNTVILLSSGVTVTWAHHGLLHKDHYQTIWGLGFTLLLGAYFTFLQGLEYMEGSFTLADSVYGATFFVATGFHGAHVIIGSLFLGVCIVRLLNGHYSDLHHLGFEAAAWYWHFVDVVWLFLYWVIYWWGG